MWMEWLVEIGLGILRVTWQPLLYAAIIFAFWTGYKRIEKERKQFGHRIFEITAEWKKTWLTGLLFGLLLSIGILLTGGLISYEWMLFVSAVTLLFLLFNQTRLLSPIYTIGISALTIWLLNFFDITIINQAISDAIYTVDFVFVSYIMLVLFLAEIILVTTTKRSRTFPGLEKVTAVSSSAFIRRNDSCSFHFLFRFKEQHYNWTSGCRGGQCLKWVPQRLVSCYSQLLLVSSSVSIAR